MTPVYPFYIVILCTVIIMQLSISQVFSDYVNYFDYSSEYLVVLIPWAFSFIVYWIYGLFWVVYNETDPNTVFQPYVKQKVPTWICSIQVLCNQVCVLLPCLFVLNYIGNVRVTETVPGIFEIASDVTIVLVIGEVLYYYVHRLLHHPRIYKYIHKMHHQYTAPIAIVSLYAHPLEVLFGNVLALIGPAFFVNMHVYTFTLSLIIGFLSSLSVHSGRDIKGRFHDLHHQYFNYNYGSIGILDFLHSTYRSQ